MLQVKKSTLQNEKLVRVTLNKGEDLNVTKYRLLVAGRPGGSGGNLVAVF